MHRPYFDESTDVSGVFRVSISPDLPRPHLGIVAAVHGNEPCGLVALSRIRRAVEAGELDLRAGTLVLIHGNPDATAEGRRYTKGGVDLNRILDYHFVDGLPPSRWTPEHHRALALRPVLESLDAALDLHSTTAPTPPFAITSRLPSSRKLAEQLGLRHLTVGWEAPGLVSDRVMIGFLARRDVPGVGVECGQHHHPEAGEVAYGTAVRFMVAHGVVDPPNATATTGRHSPPVVVQVAEAIKKPSADFRFERELGGLQHLRAGDLLGSDRNLEFRLKHDGYVLMPNDGVPVGQDMLYLARIEGDD